MFEKRSIVVTKTNQRSSTSDLAYWRSQPYIVRLAALETIRREFNQWKYHAEPGFQRVYTIVKR
ncbi:MAG: hypothetical protein F6J86_13870 [Symploca sp. SIO1B1]|nr:hypothetical protein [Symploca sp. SIO1C2]NER50946.1 hypothetical protein [Symploca sp. SIO1A3]NER94903.1 hypothetical protein [Symploca sp. SIO1B1]